MLLSSSSEGDKHFELVRPEEGMKYFNIYRSEAWRKSFFRGIRSFREPPSKLK
jgi:hypothetical protein